MHMNLASRSGSDNGTVGVFNDPRGGLTVCVKNDRNLGSAGMYFGDNPFEFVLPVTLCQLFVLLVISRSLNVILRPLRTPKSLCNLLGGILLGPSFLGRNHTYWEALFLPRQAQFLVLTSVIGAVYYIFIIAVRMDVVMTLRAAKSTWRLGVIPFLASFFTLAGLFRLYNPQKLPGTNLEAAGNLLSGAFSFTNFPVICEALMEQNLIATELGQIALSSSMLNETIQWFLIAAQRIVRTSNIKDSIIFLLAYCGLTFFCIFVVRPVMKIIVRRTPVGKPVREIYVISILVCVLVVAGIGDLVGTSFLVGPLIIGLAVPNGPPLGTTLIERSEVIVQEFLLPFFFLYIGMNTDLSVIHNWRVFIFVQCIFTAGYLVKTVASVLVSLTYDIRPKHGLALGLLLNIKGINELIIFARMRKLKLLNDQMFSHLVLCVAVMTAIISPMIRILYKRHPRILHASPSIHEGRIRTIQNTPRNSEFRIVSCVHNEGNVRGIIALLEACNPIPESPICAYVIHLIELLGKSTPFLLPLNKQNKKSMSANYPTTNHIMRAFENYSQNSSGPVTVLPYVNVAPYKNMHEAICNLAQDKLVPFLITPFHENDQTDLGGHDCSSILSLNTSFQAHAPCTVGMLVDRHSRLGSSNTAFSFHVGIFFIGGQDDREALALGIRMSERVNMRVSLFRFILADKKMGGSKKQTTREEEEEEEVQAMLDESLVDEFKAQRFGSGNVSWHEMLVDDGVEIMNAIRGLEGHYDLVMVGRRHNIGCFTDEEMSHLIENAEILGIFGDMLASTEFCGGLVPVLVTHCGGKKVHRLDRVGSATVSQKSLG